MTSTVNPRALSVYNLDDDGAVAPTQVIVTEDSGAGSIFLTPSHMVALHMPWGATNRLETYAVVDGPYALSSEVALENENELGIYYSRVAVAAFDDTAVVTQYPTGGARLDLLSWTDDGWVTGREVTEWPSSPETSVSLAMTDDVLVVADRETTEVYVYVLDRSLGAPCTDDAECTQGFCRDGVCCDSACGDGVIDDCLACSVAMGAPRDGVCSPSTGNTCPDGDDDICTVGTCTDGQCSSAPLVCDDENPCTLDSCGSEGCEHTNLDDDTPCSSGTCTDGKCAPVDAPVDGGARVDAGDATLPPGCTCGASTSSSETGAHAFGVLCLCVARLVRNRVRQL